MRRIPIYTSDKSRIVGYVERDAYITPRRASVHQLRVPPAWAFDFDVLERAQQLGATRVIVRELEHNEEYEAQLADVLHGIPVSRGFGEQVALPLAFWRVNGLPSEHERQTLRPGQLALFGQEVCNDA